MTIIITDYIAIKEDNIADLNTAVNAQIALGFTPSCTLQSAMCLNVTDLESAFVQSMAKYEEEGQVVMFDYEYKAISNSDITALNTDFDTQEGLGFTEFGQTTVAMCLDAMSAVAFIYAQPFIKPL